jgi:glucokinase
VSNVTVGLDIGGTKLLGGLVTQQGEILATCEVPTPRSPQGCDPGLVALSELARGLRSDAQKAGHVVRGVGLGFAEYVADNLLTSAEVFAWDRQPADLMSDVWPGVPVVVGADVRCAAFAESRRRRMSSHQSMFYVSWGTGLSSSLMLGSVPLAGGRGEALAFGELSVNSAVEPGWAGNLESYASGRALGLRYETVTPSSASGADVASWAGQGDETAAKIISSAALAVAYALRDCVLLLDPDVIVLGGGVGTSGGSLPGLVATSLSGLLIRPRPPEVVPALAGAEAGLVGAGLSAWQAIDQG